jgi:hypothetical protein
MNSWNFHKLLLSNRGLLVAESHTSRFLIVPYSTDRVESGTLNNPTSNYKHPVNGSISSRRFRFPAISEPTHNSNAHAADTLEKHFQNSHNEGGVFEAFWHFVSFASTCGWE